MLALQIWHLLSLCDQLVAELRIVHIRKTEMIASGLLP